MMMQWEEEDADSLARELIETGLATLNRYNYLTLNPALCPYLRRDRFTRLDEPGSVAVFWHQTGIVYEKAGQPEAAEDSYRKSLEIRVRLGDFDGQAATLNQLGSLYDDVLNRQEEAAAFFRQAVYKSVRSAREGARRYGLARMLYKLCRFDEARNEILRAIECDAQLGHTSESGRSWAVLAAIEMADGNATAAAEAKRKAITSYLAYRRAGGENHEPVGRVCLAVSQPLLAGDAAAAASLLAEPAADPDLPSLVRTFIQAHQAIVAGSRDRTLADDPDLDYTMAAEILFLLDRLEK